MGEWYDKPAWDAAPAVNEGQSFNGGELRQLTEFDVFAPDRWTWMGGDPALYEGWTVPQGQATPLRAGGLELVGDGPHHLDSPYLPPLEAEDYVALRVELDDPLAGRVLWRAADEDFAEARALPLVEGRAALATHPAWQGTIQQLRLVIEGGTVARTVNLVAAPLDDLPPKLDAGSPAPPALDATVASPRRDGGLFSDLGPARAHSFRAEPGCHCDQGPMGSPLWLGLVALAGLRRRRRGHGPGRAR
jgi:MYXO-CTERM domain-containing protein